MSMFHLKFTMSRLTVPLVTTAASVTAASVPPSTFSEPSWVHDMKSRNEASNHSFESLSTFTAAINPLHLKAPWTNSISMEQHSRWLTLSIWQTIMESKMCYFRWGHMDNIKDPAKLWDQIADVIEGLFTAQFRVTYLGQPEGAHNLCGLEMEAQVQSSPRIFDFQVLDYLVSLKDETTGRSLEAHKPDWMQSQPHAACLRHTVWHLIFKGAVSSWDLVIITILKNLALNQKWNVHNS